LRRKSIAALIKRRWKAVIESFFSKKKFSSSLNTEIMCLKIDNYTIQKSLNKQSSSQKSKTTIFSSTTRRRSVSVLQMISNQNINNALTILRYRFFEKKSVESYWLTKEWIANCCLFNLDEKISSLYKNSLYSFIYWFFIFWFIEILLRIEIFVRHERFFLLIKSSSSFVVISIWFHQNRVFNFRIHWFLDDLENQ
jgi:hypothetical protein